MKPFLATFAFGGLMLFPMTSARRGMSAASIPRLTAVADYTFHSLCYNLRNPDPYFDEMDAVPIINGFVNDLVMYLQGAGPTDIDDPEDNVGDEPCHSIGGPKVPRRQGQLMPHQSASKDVVAKTSSRLDCKRFESDLKLFDETFQNMTYAISEKCYRQCYPDGRAAYSMNMLQTRFENSPYYGIGSFYTQIREIQAEHDCHFNDLFLIETQRATDNAKVWIETFQSKRSPCAETGKRGSVALFNVEDIDSQELR